MKKMKSKKILTGIAGKIVFVLVLTLFLASRIYKIAEIPASVYWDEASIGYNAYSIATDLKDEWGETLPLHFRAFGEFKLPVYIYSVAVFVRAIGLNANAVRLPSVLYSLGTMVFVYLLTKKITKKTEIAILASFIITLSPWFFIFSRTGYEATAALFFFLAGTFLFLLEKKKYYLPFSIFSFILSFYSYNSFRILIPIWLTILFIYKFHEVKKIKQALPVLILSGLIFLISLIPVYRLYKYDAGSTRLTQVQISNEIDFFKNYVANFSSQFLFFQGDINPRSQIPGHGQLYLFELPLILLGILAIFKSKKKLYFLPLAALLIAPIPVALTKESPHALRAILAAPSFAVISAMGVLFLQENFKKIGTFVLLAVVGLYLFSFKLYLTSFISDYNQNTSSAWQYQYKEIFSRQTEGVVTDEYAQPYIFALYYLKYPPEKFRQEVVLNPVDQWGFSKVASFNGFEFK